MTWLSENIMSIILLLVLALIVFLILRSKLNLKKSNRCSCGCTGCSGCSGCNAMKRSKQQADSDLEK